MIRVGKKGVAGGNLHMKYSHKLCGSPSNFKSSPKLGTKGQISALKVNPSASTTTDAPTSFSSYLLYINTDSFHISILVQLFSK